VKRLLTPMKFLVAFALLAFAVGCATTQQTENLLSAAGFNTVIASTPKQQQHLKTLKPDKITSVKRNGKTYFVFQQLRLQQKLSNENLIAAEMDEHEDQMLHEMLAGWD
jgi:uncharacterized lipoprotein YmbA